MNHRPRLWTMSEIMRARLAGEDAFMLLVWFLGQSLSEQPSRLALIYVGQDVIETCRPDDITKTPIFINLASVAAIAVED